jgi:hypothetical protein
MHCRAKESLGVVDEFFGANDVDTRFTNACMRFLGSIFAPLHVCSNGLPAQLAVCGDAALRFRQNNHRVAKPLDCGRWNPAAIIRYFYIN